MDPQAMVLFELEVVACLENTNNFVQQYLRLVETVSKDPLKQAYQCHLVDYIKKVIKSPKYDALTKFLALMLLKQVLETYDLELLKYAQAKLLSRLKLLAEYRNSSLPEDQQARDIFGSNKNAHFSQAFFDLNVECLKNWAATYGSVKELKKYALVYSQVRNKMVARKSNYQVDKLQEDFFFKDYVGDNLQNNRVSQMKASKEPQDQLAYFCFEVQLKKQPLSIRKSLTASKMEELQSQLRLIQNNQAQLEALDKADPYDQMESDEGDSPSPSASQIEPNQTDIQQEHNQSAIQQEHNQSAIQQEPNHSAIQKDSNQSAIQPEHNQSAIQQEHNQSNFIDKNEDNVLDQLAKKTKRVNFPGLEDNSPEVSQMEDSRKKVFNTNKQILEELDRTLDQQDNKTQMQNMQIKNMQRQLQLKQEQLQELQRIHAETKEEVDENSLRAYYNLKEENYQTNTHWHNSLYQEQNRIQTALPGLQDIIKDTRLRLQEEIDEDQPIQAQYQRELMVRQLHFYESQYALWQQDLANLKQDVDTRQYIGSGTKVSGMEGDQVNINIWKHRVSKLELQLLKSTTPQKKKVSKQTTPRASIEQYSIMSMANKDTLLISQEQPVLPTKIKKQRYYVQLNEFYKGLLEGRSGQAGYELDYLRCNALQNRGVLFENKEVMVSYQINGGGPMLQGTLEVMNKKEQGQWVGLQYDLQDGVQLKGGQGGSREEVYLEEEHLQPFRVDYLPECPMQLLMCSLYLADRPPREIVVPFSLNKFFRHTFMNQSMYDGWQYKIKVVTPLYRVDPSVIRYPEDFGNYLPYLLRLQSKSNCGAGEPNEYPCKYGSLFQFMDKQYLVKISYYAGRGEVEFSCLGDDPRESGQQAILNVLAFLFSAG